MSAETVERQLTEARMKDREGAGLAGKVAIVSGGGAAGDGIGNGRAAAILLARAGHQGAWWPISLSSLPGARSR